LGPEDFKTARNAIVDFEEWAAFKDYVFDREGLAMGLCSAGEDTRLVGVPSSAFETWRRDARAAPTLANLDAFAALLRAHFAHLAGSAESISRWDDRIARDADDFLEMSLAVRVANSLYGEWLACLASMPIFSRSAPSPEAYARLMLEAWAGDR
jgi:hypothetical protein